MSTSNWTGATSPRSHSTHHGESHRRHGDTTHAWHGAQAAAVAAATAADAGTATVNPMRSPLKMTGAPAQHRHHTATATSPPPAPPGATDGAVGDWYDLADSGPPLPTRPTRITNLLPASTNTQPVTVPLQTHTAIANAAAAWPPPPRPHPATPHATQLSPPPPKLPPAIRPLPHNYDPSRGYHTAPQG